jgi:hypothetical protein
VLESIFYGNAMYVFGRNWEQLVAAPKVQIIQGDLAENSAQQGMGRSSSRRHAAKGGGLTSVPLEMVA